MKTLIATLILTTAAIASFAQQGTLTVTVSEISNSKGIILIGLSNNEKTFLKEMYKSEKAKAVQGSVTIQFNNLPAGDYAISIIHDENENNDLDSNMVGIPKEGFGFSNDAMGSFGPPSFEKAKINFNGKEAKCVVKMKYF